VNKFSVLMGLALAAVTCAASAIDHAAADAVVLNHVNVVPMTANGHVLRDQCLLLQEGRIARIEACGTGPAPANARQIDAAGKWLIPGLFDMHTHLENGRLLRLYTRQENLPRGIAGTAPTLLPYVANGVLQVLNLSSMPETIAQRDEVESGRVLGPHIAMAAMIDGDPPVWPEGLTRVASTPQAGRQAVRDAAGDGYDYIKVYSHLDLATFSAIVDEAHQRKMRVIGHIPERRKATTQSFFQPGFDLVGHAEEFAEQTAEPSLADIPRYVQMAKANQTSLVATLSLDERILEEMKDPDSLKRRPELRHLNPVLRSIVLEHNPYVAARSPEVIAHMGRVVAFNRALVKAFAQAGITVLAGTDSPVPGVVPGYSLHDELEALVKAGLSTEQALNGATRAAAEWLHVDADRGSVAVGKRADLVLLDADPLKDIANTRRIAAVIVGGQYHAHADLDASLQAIEAK
jgi:imidazolonepropionase-like amidohydrolase